MEQIEALKQNLKNFGLNPDNWNVFQKSEKNKFLIVNKKNKSFKLVGISSYQKKNNSTWKDLLVISI